MREIFTKALLYMASAMLLVQMTACNGSKSSTQVTDGDQKDLDSLNCYERTRIGDYIQEVDTCTLSYSSAILRDTLGHFVAESVSDGHGGSYISFFYDNQGIVSDICLGDDSALDNYDEVDFLTNSCRNDKCAIVFTLERDSNGKIVQVRSPKSNDKIVCSPGGEITYTIIRNPGWVSNISELYQGGFLNVEFLVRSPKDNRGNWEETTYLSYHKTQYRKYENNKLAKAEAISLVNSKILKKVNFLYSEDTLTILSENLKDTLFENKVFVGNQLLSYIKKSRWGTILEKENYEVTESGEVVCHCENYDFSTKALKSISPYKVKQEDIDLTKCLKNIFEGL